MFNQPFQEWTHEQFRALLEAAPDATVIADQQGTIILVNAQTERIFGYTRDELLGSLLKRSFPTAIAVDTSATARNPIAAAPSKFTCLVLENLLNVMTRSSRVKILPTAPRLSY